MLPVVTSTTPPVSRTVRSQQQDNWGTVNWKRLGKRKLWFNRSSTYEFSRPTEESHK